MEYILYDGRLFADGIFKSIFLHENYWMLIQISLNDKYARNDSDNAWRPSGDKPFIIWTNEGLVYQRICVTPAQWVN